MTKDRSLFFHFRHLKPRRDKKVLEILVEINETMTCQVNVKNIAEAPIE